MSVFKAYDIRGRYPDLLNEDLARRIGDAFVRLLGARTLLVGRDMRTMAPSMAAALIQGAARAGAEVIDIGLASTPMTYFAIGQSGVDGGVQVTASHNPSQDIGFKFCRKGCVPVSRETGIQEMESMVQAGLGPAASKPGRIQKQDLLAAYQNDLLERGQGIKPLKLVLDTANGMAGHALPGVLEKLPVVARLLFGELDGTFPNHEADPTKARNLVALQQAVKESDASLGLAFDGDADRCVFMDGEGEAIRSDFVTAALAADFLEQEPGASVVYDLRSTRAVREAISAAGGRPIMERVGHSFIKATMRREKAIFAGELSGHFYFRDNFYSDSGELAMMAMLRLLSKRGGSLRELVRPYRKYASTGEINFRVPDPDGALEAMKEHFGDGRLLELDGVTVEYRDWWFNLRKSNTEPLVRLTMEADTESLLDEKRTVIFSHLGQPLP